MTCIHAFCLLAVLGGTFTSALAETGKSRPIQALAGIVYGETSGLRPACKDPNSPRDTSNCDPRSARQLSQARAWIARVSLNRGHRGVADVTYLTARERRLPEALTAWRQCLGAARLGYGNVASEGTQHFLLRKGGNPRTGGTPRRPDWAKGHLPIKSFGPFRCVGGGDVPAGENIWIDFFENIPM